MLGANTYIKYRKYERRIFMKKLLKKSQEHLRELLRSENPKEYY